MLKIPSSTRLPRSVAEALSIWQDMGGDIRYDGGYLARSKHTRIIAFISDGKFSYMDDSLKVRNVWREDGESERVFLWRIAKELTLCEPLEKALKKLLPMSDDL